MAVCCLSSVFSHTGVGSPGVFTNSFEFYVNTHTSLFTATHTDRDRQDRLCCATKVQYKKMDFQNVGYPKSWQKMKSKTW